MIALAVLVLVLPGYLLARALRLPAAPAAAFPLSALLIAETVVAFTLLRVPLRFRDALVAIAAVSLPLLAACRRRPTAVDEDDPGDVPRPPDGRTLRVSALLLAASVLA